MLLAPTARFGDTAANELALSSLSHLEMPLAMKTLCASVTAAAFRVSILPLDAWKVMKQVHGKVRDITFSITLYSVHVFIHACSS